MKKAILVLLFCAILTATVSCNTSDGGTETVNDTTNTISTTTIAPITTQTPTTTQIPVTTVISSGDKTPVIDSPQLAFYLKFKEAVDSNAYDTWLEQTLAEGVRGEYEVYAEYLAKWKDELAFTIENGKRLFENEEDYTLWKNELNEWLLNTQNILKTEMNLMVGQVAKLEVIIPHCELVRQKVVDTKKFLYYFEQQVLTFQFVDNQNVPIIWKYSNEKPSENVYQDVINQYQELLTLKKNNANYEEIYLSSNEEGNEIQTAVYHAILCNNPEKMGYAMKDLNGDGVDELILLNEDYHIYAIFTAINGKSVVVDDVFFGDSNHRGAIGPDGTIYKHGYGKGENVYGSIMKLSDDGRLSGIEFGCSDVDIDDSAVDYYKIVNGVRESIDYNEFKRLNDAYYETVGNSTDLTKQSCGNFVRMKIE